MLLVYNVIVMCAVFGAVCQAQIWPKPRLTRRQQARFQIKTALDLKNRIKERINQYRERNTQLICYEIVGCFNLPHKNSPLQKVPEDPKTLDTKFHLFTRHTDLSKPEILYYEDSGRSINESSFDASKPLKVVVHGYTSKWNEKGSIVIMNTYLKLYDCNVILMDWHVGARGPNYPVAAANTELVGRQLGILLTYMVLKGLDPRKIHLIGFSLGAHVCGTASESLKNKGYLLGRITGLDPASPLFRNNYFREKYKKLDRSDAKLVDVLHTDSSPFVTDGFGLYEPIGHVDFFPNGGQDQPGCNDVKDSIVVSHFERGLSKELVCSHVRAFQLFKESLQNLLDKRNNKDACEFTAYNCAREMAAFEEGSCFPTITNENLDVGKFGEDVRGEGMMFFSTRASSKFCGTQLQVTVELSEKCGPLKGILLIQIWSNKETNKQTLQLNCEYKNTEIGIKNIYGLGTVKYKTITPDITNLQARLSYFDLRHNHTNVDYQPAIYFNKMEVRDMFGNSWGYCKKDTRMADPNKQMYGLLTLNLTKNECSSAN